MAAPDAAVAAHGREAGPLEHAEMLGDAGQRHVETVGDLLDRAIAAGELGENRASRAIGESAERGVERIFGVNHMVYY